MTDYGNKIDSLIDSIKVMCGSMNCVALWKISHGVCKLLAPTKGRGTCFCLRLLQIKTVMDVHSVL